MLNYHHILFVSFTFGSKRTIQLILLISHFRRHLHHVLIDFKVLPLIIYFFDLHSPKLKQATRTTRRERHLFSLLIFVFKIQLYE